MSMNPAGLSRKGPTPLAADRRSFLQQAAVGAVAASAISMPAAAGANDRVVMGLIGCGGRGTHVAKLLAEKPGVEFRYVCDPDEARRKQAASELGSSGIRQVGDLRQVLDDKDVIAVLVATPDHWHAPASILACDAGKHVYCEKPCSHNIREGRLLVEAARRNNVHVQHGTQVRSTSMIASAIQRMREGAIGPVLMAKVWNVQRRGPIGRAQPSAPPAGFDYDTWIGPAPFVDFQANRHHGSWKWWYDFGTGDMGNDGVHDIDYGRWGLGVTTHPSRVSAIGGRFLIDDDQQFPDTQQVAFEYEGHDGAGDRKILVYEQRLWSTNYPHNTDSGVEFYGPGGQMFISRRGKVELLDEKNRRVDLGLESEPQNEVRHTLNFVESIRGKEKLNAEIEIGHLSTTLCHLGNIATRLERSLRFDPQAERFLSHDGQSEDAEANALVGRHYRSHWGTPVG
ncbi:MAG: Gfo/Idh/MocA family oxidoreductase [Pirellulales bacterium]|nr:Gfo/Idh/MocA family oxidoreductase [Pirellulales bacterium]